MASSSKDLIRENLDTIILNLLDERADCPNSILAKEIDAKTSGQYKVQAGTLNKAIKKLEEDGFVTFNMTSSSKKLYSITEMGKNTLIKKKAEYEYERTKTDELLSSKRTNLSALPPVARQVKKKRPKQPLATSSDNIAIDANTIPEYGDNITIFDTQTLTLAQDNKDSVTIDTRTYNNIYNNIIVGNNAQSHDDNNDNVSTSQYIQTSIYNDNASAGYDAPPIVSAVDTNSILQDIYNNQQYDNSYVDNQQRQEYVGLDSCELSYTDDNAFDFAELADASFIEDDIAVSMPPTPVAVGNDSSLASKLNPQIERQQILDREYKKALTALLKPFSPKIIIKKKPKKLEAIKPITRTLIKQPVEEPAPQTNTVNNSEAVDYNNIIQTHDGGREPNFTIEPSTATYSTPTQYKQTIDNTYIKNEHISNHIYGPTQEYPRANQSNSMQSSTQSRPMSAATKGQAMPSEYTHNSALPLVRSHNQQPKLEQQKNDYYQYRLMATQYTLLFLFMFLEIVFTFLMIKIVFKLSQANDIALYSIATGLSLFFLVYARMRKISNDDKTRRYTDEYKFLLLINFVIFITCAIITFIIHLILGMNLALMSKYATSLILPIVLSINFPLNSILHAYLCKTEKYSVSSS